MISVVIPARNESAVIGRLLSGLLDDAAPDESLPAGMAGLRYHLVIADNASADDTVTLAQRLAPDCTIVQTGRNAGYAAGFNAGLAAARPYDAALILNPDIRLSPGCVARLYRQLGDGVGIAVPRIRNEDGSVARSLRREPTIARALGEGVFGQRRALLRARRDRGG